jgi:hypothetical protein
VPRLLLNQYAFLFAESSVPEGRGIHPTTKLSLRKGKNVLKDNLSKLMNSRTLATGLFVIGGTVLTMVSVLAGGAFYITCFFVLIPLGLLWMWRPALAAALSIGPLVVIACLVYLTMRGAMRGPIMVSGIALGLATYLLVAILLIIAALRGTRHWRLPLVLSLAFLAAVFATDRLFTNVTTTKTFQMNAALDGNTPWDEDRPEQSKGSGYFVLYRRVGNMYCWDGIFSEELLDHLKSRHLNTVTVQYDEFSNFGRVRGYNLRSVDGVILAIGSRVIKDTHSRSGVAFVGEGGGMLDGKRCY